MKYEYRTNKKGQRVIYKSKNVSQFWLRHEVMARLKKLKELYELLTMKKFSNSEMIEELLNIAELKVDLTPKENETT